jgi:hypothetical protein
LPYWIYIPVLFIFIILVPFFWEGILFAILINIIYAKNMGMLALVLSPLTVIALIVIIVLLPIRDKLRLYV